MNVIDLLFATEIRENGSHCPTTLPEYAGRFLADIEHQFGPRDRSFTLLGIDIDRTPNSSPRLWHPSRGIRPDDGDRRSRHVVIRLGSNALTDSVRAKWQLAHECLHLLDPWNETVDGRSTNWLEEGLAARYQNSRVSEAEHHEGMYAIAEDIVRPLMYELPQAVKRIRMERRLPVGESVADGLQSYCPTIGGETARSLCEPFRNQTTFANLDAANEADEAELGNRDRHNR